MPGKHKEPTIAFRPSAWARAIIEQRAALSGIYKKDFITRSCVYSNIVVVGKKENIQRIVDSLQEMQMVIKEIAGQIQSGDFSLSEESYLELKRDCPENIILRHSKISTINKLAIPMAGLFPDPAGLCLARLD